MFCNSEASMHNTKSAPAAGILSCAGFVCSWGAISFGPRIAPAKFVPYVLIAVLVVLLCSTLLAVVAGRFASKWWYLLVAAGVISLAVLLASVAI